MIIEAKIRNYLKSLLSVPVYLERPEKPPDSFVIIERVGGYESNFVSHGTFAVKSIGKTMYEAASLDYDVVAAMRDIVSLDNISGCTLNADTNFTDTTTKEYRYQSTYIIDYMED
jgi:hypothetical protein